MSRLCTTGALFLLTIISTQNVVDCSKKIKDDDPEMGIKMVREGFLDALSSARGLQTLDGSGRDLGPVDGPVGDCLKLYGDAEPRLAQLLLASGNETIRDGWSHDEDALTWLSGALASHSTCLDGLRENGLLHEAQWAENLDLVIREALATYGVRRGRRRRPARKGKLFRSPHDYHLHGLLATWDSSSSKADYVVAQDGSGNYRTINEAVSALSENINDNNNNYDGRVVIYVKSGTYREKVEIGRDIKNVMLVGDGIDKTIVTGDLNVQDGATTFNSATFGVSGDGFWARDITFENTAGPHKHQAVALRVSSDLSVFYRCSFKGYQDTLFAHSLRQFYRECRIYGTVDFIFGDSAAVLQSCDILVRRPMDHQSNVITASGRDDPNSNTGIAVLGSRVGPADDFREVKWRFKSYLGRPWKKYSRVAVFKTDLDGLIDGEGWKEWSGDFALSTLYYAEYMNTGAGSYTGGRVKWPSFHVLGDPGEAGRFSVRNFIAGDSWIPATGVPFSPDV